MNRYLFKAKRKDNNDWVYGYLFKTPLTADFNCDGQYFSSMVRRTCISNEDGCVFEVIPETICQYLGSINDIDLYENDIVKGFEDMYDNEVQGTVVLNLENGIQLHCKNNIYHFDYIYDFKVIGNKFDEVDNNE